MGIENFFQLLPGVAKPKERLSFKTRLKWTGIILILYFVLSDAWIWGVNKIQFAELQTMASLLGASFGTLMTLGIGPIVTASIIMQLFVGSKIIPWDLSTQHGKILFQGTQKALAFGFTVVEAAAYALFGAIQPVSWAPMFIGVILIQLTLGGWLVIFMDEVVSKWGFGSGVSLFILAGVAKQIFIAGSTGIFALAKGVFIEGAPLLSYSVTIIAIAATLTVFILAVYAQAMKVEIPLAWGTIRGFGQKWPLRFIYTSNIPVILTAVLVTNIHIIAQIAASRGAAWFAVVQNGAITGGLSWLLFTHPTITEAIQIPIFALILGISVIGGTIIAYYFMRERTLEIVGGFVALGTALGLYVIMTAYGLPPLIHVGRAIFYTIFFVLCSVMFSIFWVNTSGMDAGTVAQQIQGSGLQIPGFRRDPRIIEHVLNRYIPTLTILGGAFVGFLAAFADFTHALAAGTSILLAVMIVYQLYEQLAYQHLEDLHPMLRRFISKE